MGSSGHLILVLLSCASYALASKSHWDYKSGIDKYHWAEHFKQCGGSRQSPIHVWSESCRKTEMPAVILKSKTVYKNNDHSVQFQVERIQDVQMSGGPLDGPYRLAQFHFHWGSNKSQENGLGSEHRMNNENTVMEMHLVTFNMKYDTIKKAMSKPDGLAVFAILFAVGKGGYPMNQLLSKKMIEKVQKAETTAETETPEVPLVLQLINPLRYGRKYFFYNGSTTTPPCVETVKWIISQDIMEVSEETLNLLRSLRNKQGNPLEDNFRQLQPLNGRTVFCN